MSMRWDPLLAAATARELSDRLAGARVRALLLEPESRRVLVFLREHTLVLELHPRRGWISLLPPREPLLAARRYPLRVRSVTALPDESALVFGLPRVRGKDEGVELVAEMVGNRWNALVVGHRTRTIRHVLVPRTGGGRELTVGAPYRPPPSTGRRGVDRDLDSDEWRAIREEADTPGEGQEGEEPARILLRKVAWTSSLNVGELARADGRERWLAMTDPERWAAWLLPDATGTQAYPVPLHHEGAAPFSGLLEAMAAGRANDEETGPLHELLLPPDLLARAEKALRRARGKVEGLRRELENARDPAPIRAMGDLILARFSEIPRGAERATLTGFDGEPVEVELDPGRPPHENARRYYDEAGRVERAREELPDRIERAEAEAGRLRERLDAVRSGEVPPEALDELMGPGAPTGKKPGKKGTEPARPYRRFTSSGGLEIRVGRGPRHNDDLTFRNSDPGDVWLHVRQAPGAHVILRWKGDGNPPRRDLVEAATLAALNSEARHSGSVPVDWTRRKYVRKPRKAAPGAVVPDRIETLFVEPDPAVAERLKG